MTDELFHARGWLDTVSGLQSVVVRVPIGELEVAYVLAVHYCWLETLSIGSTPTSILLNLSHNHTPPILGGYGALSYNWAFANVVSDALVAATGGGGMATLNVQLDIPEPGFPIGGDQLFMAQETGGNTVDVLVDIWYKRVKVSRGVKAAIYERTVVTVP